jgi:8-oxo-dGTP diphosphatase
MTVNGDVMPDRTDMSRPTLRVRALLVSAGHILLARLQVRPVAFLPGGRVEPGEALMDALSREVKEECGAVAEKIAYLGVAENIWRENGRRMHDLSHFFLVESRDLDPSVTPRCNDEGVEMYWIPSSQMKHEPIKPESVKQLLCNWLDGARNTWWAYEREA